MKVPVLVSKIFNFPFTYDSGSIKNLMPGDLVIVPFGKKEEIGVVWDQIQLSNKDFKIKTIKQKINNFKINKSLINFINWFSSYNLVSRGMVLKMCLGDKKNAIKIEEYKREKINKKKKFTLSNEQIKSIEALKKFGDTFNVSLLQGVTGSGKTLVYFERVKKILNSGKQALILLPEIFLTNQFKERFEEFFGFLPAIWHSKIGIKSKRKIWQGVINGNLNLVIGARSSLLLPFKKLGIIVLDEEHDPSYKQDEGIIYHARDMAIARCSMENIPIHLVSAVPSLETYNNVKKKKYNYTKLSNRYSDYPLPEAKVINLEKISLKKDQFIADETLELIENFLEKKDQVLFFLNRRGYAPFLICKKCGFKHLCPNCSIYLTYHKLIKKLICHHCGIKVKKEKVCDAGKEDNCDFRMYGPGVEKIYEELKKIFPKKNIKIFSSDFLSKKNETDSILKKIEKNEIDIIIGTQLISKGFNFPKLNCIVVVDADFSGMGYDLRTTEKNIQLYNQLSGRAGRFSNKSLIIYQTVTPLNETLKDVLENNPEKFLNNELIIRKNKNLPPFSRLISLIISSNSSQDSFRAAQEIKMRLTTINQLEVLGPVDSPIFKIKKKYRTRLLLRSKSGNLIQKNVGKVLQNLTISKKIKLTVDVDPINFA